MNIPISKNEPTTFRSIFFPSTDDNVRIRVPDYQRAYSWEYDQTKLFIEDLRKYKTSGSYYFGHYIAEKAAGMGSGICWEVVDGQQRITTFVLFLIVCRLHSPTGAHVPAYSLIERFTTVGYDNNTLSAVNRETDAFLKMNTEFSGNKKGGKIRVEQPFCNGPHTRSQERILRAILHFNEAFQKGESEGGLDKDRIADYIEVIMGSLCSLHLTETKAVAVNIFEMHNTRGVKLTTLDTIKAKLMKFVYDNAAEGGDRSVGKIQEEFGEIYALEEQLAISSFRRDMTIDQLLRLHLRVVDDGAKRDVNVLNQPPSNANASQLIEYVERMLHFTSCDDKKATPKTKENGVLYAVNLSKEIKRSVQIVSQHLPAWDKDEPLVGDVLILEPDLSCEFFLIICRKLAESGKADGHVSNDVLLRWERLLFTRDFHDCYYGKHNRDDFPALFASLYREDKGEIQKNLSGYLKNGFRHETKGLQSIVCDHLKKSREKILNTAFYWSKSKMIYAIYKYEVKMGANIRNVMKGTISVEHILPQQWEGIRNEDKDLKAMSEAQWDEFRKKISDCINGLGNLLLITSQENTSQGNTHPALKEYKKYCAGGSYQEHDKNRNRWAESGQWSNLIRQRGERILEFTMEWLVGDPTSGE
ncbi:DUF262 domain-containing protein [Opitutaceae bacterium TAV4]|nr:DUF262 domain-containing protein [Opitutaceae bacterium TAV3]RRK01450.1 DUF262 domain-containing protein [Opitutaceae bacterium TAV4]